MTGEAPASQSTYRTARDIDRRAGLVLAVGGTAGRHRYNAPVQCLIII